MSQLVLFRKEEKRLVNLREASKWASQYLNRNVTISNVSYLLQYGRIKKYGSNGNPLIDIDELKGYYDFYDKEKQWKKKQSCQSIGTNDDENQIPPNPPLAKGGRGDFQKKFKVYRFTGATKD